jgi:hypothetical protein
MHFAAELDKADDKEQPQDLAAAEKRVLGQVLDKNAGQ